MIGLLHKLVRIQGDQGTYHKRDPLKYSFYTWAKIKKHIQGLLRFMAATAALLQHHTVLYSRDRLFLETDYCVHGTVHPLYCTDTLITTHLTKFKHFNTIKPLLW